MFLTVHTLAGVAIASQIPNSLVAAPLSFMSHFALDALPHWTTRVSNLDRQKTDRLVLYLDFTLSVAIGLFFAFRSGFFNRSFWLIILCVILANLPDAIRFPYLVLKYKSRFLVWWEKIHIAIDQDVSHRSLFAGQYWLGIGVQVVTMILCVWLSL